MTEETALATQSGDMLGMLSEVQLAQLTTHANIFWKSGFCPKKFDNPESIVITAMYGREIGMSFMQALTDIHVIDGIPSLSAPGQGGVIRQRLPAAKIVLLEQNEMVCRISMWRPGMDEPQEFSYTIEDAGRANLTGKDNWIYNPTDMLTWRCSTRGYRFIFKDILGSFGHTPEELYELRSRTPMPALPAAAPTGGIPKVDPAEAEAAAGIPEDDKPAADPHELDGLDSELQAAETPSQADVAYDDWRARNKDKPSTLVDGYKIYTKFLEELKSPPSEATQAELITEEESK